MSRRNSLRAGPRAAPSLRPERNCRETDQNESGCETAHSWTSVAGRSKDRTMQLSA